MYIANSHLWPPQGHVAEHALGVCIIKFESNSIRILLSAGYNSFELFIAVADAKVKVKVKNQKAPNSGQSKFTALLCIAACCCSAGASLIVLS